MIQTIETTIDGKGKIRIPSGLHLPPKKKALVIVFDDTDQALADTIKKSKINHTQFRNKLTRHYRKNRDRLKGTFPSAFDFLRNVEDAGGNVWVFTSKNAYIYSENCFLVRIRLNETGSKPQIQLTPQKASRLIKGTRNQSAAFLQLDPMIESLAGFKSGWAQKIKSGGYKIGPAAPPEFFNQLLLRTTGWDNQELGLEDDNKTASSH